ncbi:MAG: OsmC family protein [Woeseiaceae bacterium]
MSTHRATVQWSQSGESFAYEYYSRNHIWRIGDNKIHASAAPEYLGDPDHIDPEQAFVAAVASCHMLTFLAIASRKRLKVESYRDEAIGYMTKNDRGRLAVTRVELRPSITFSPADAVSATQLSAMHDRSHEECFIANSVTSDIVVLTD